MLKKKTGYHQPGEQKRFWVGKGMLMLSSSPGGSSGKQEYNMSRVPSSRYDFADDINGVFFICFRWPPVQVQS